MDSYGPVHADSIPKKKTINADYYCECLKKKSKRHANQNTLSKRVIILHHSVRPTNDRIANLGSTVAPSWSRIGFYTKVAGIVNQMNVFSHNT